jgi:hypothetical protein
MDMGQVRNKSVSPKISCQFLKDTATGTKQGKENDQKYYQLHKNQPRLETEAKEIRNRTLRRKRARKRLPIGTKTGKKKILWLG